jgi:hypothetical protein
MSRLIPKNSLRVNLKVRTRVMLGLVSGATAAIVIAAILFLQIDDDGTDTLIGNGTLRSMTKTYPDLNFKKTIAIDNNYFISSDGSHFTKLDSVGNVAWHVKIDASFPLLIQSLVQTTDKGIVAVCQTSGIGGISKVYAIKVDLNGNLKYAKLFSKALSEFSYGAAATDDNSIVICGSGCTTSNYLLKLNQYGDQEWIKDFGIAQTITNAQRVIINDDNSITVAGREEENGNHYLYINQFDNNANFVSGKKYSVQHQPLVKAIIKSNDDGFILVGNFINSYSANPFILKTDINGNAQWFKTIGTDEVESINDVIITNENQMILVGNIFINANENVDAMVLKMDMSGNIIWQFAAGSESLNGAGYDDALAISKANNDLYMITGFSNGGFVTVMDEQGNGFCHYVPINLDIVDENIQASTLQFAEIQNLPFNASTIGTSGNLIAVSSPSVCYGNFTGATTSVETQANDFENIDIKIYPNPSDGRFTIVLPPNRKEDATIQLFDLTGKEMMSRIVKSSEDQLKINQTEFSNGTYLLSVRIGNKIMKQTRIVIQN